MNSAEGISFIPPGYMGWRNRFLEIDSWALLKFKIRALSYLNLHVQNHLVKKSRDLAVY
jgi:hypothetical protein